MVTHALQAWTGPCFVNEIADRLASAGVHVACVGTERVYITAEGQTAEGAAHDVLVDLIRMHGTDFGLHFRRV